MEKKVEIGTMEDMVKIINSEKEEFIFNIGMEG